MAEAGRYKTALFIQSMSLNARRSLHLPIHTDSKALPVAAGSVIPELRQKIYLQLLRRCSTVLVVVAEFSRQASAAAAAAAESLMLIFTLSKSGFTDGAVYLGMQTSELVADHCG